MKIVKNTLLVLALGASTINAADLLATVNGTKVTTEDADRFVRAANPQQSFETASDKDKAIIVERLVERVLFIEAAKKAGVENNPDYIKTLDRAKNELLINQWMKNQYDSTVISASESKEYYEKNLKQFSKSEQVRARHILLKDDEAGAKEIISQLSALSGDKLKEKFIELAKSKSEGPTGPKGGDLGFFGKGQMVAPFDKVVFALTKGKVTTEPVKTQFGYHVIYLEDKKSASTTPYEDVKAQIVENLKQMQFREMLTKSAKEMKSKAEIVIEKVKK
ncbi:MAG TPA: peptidylprolyl isomerase [Campylobacterales bacterium]|nr:peptidylprolyl isomerase [Campylobacterales bacterium]